MRKVMCFGTFDGVHKGHEHYLRQAKKLGDFLVVVVALDETVKKIKNREPHYPADERAGQLQQLGFVYKIILGNPGDKLKVVADEKPDVICLGYDQTFFTDNLKEKLRQRGLKPEIVRIGAYMPEKFKSSKMSIVG
ncbi:MAG: FAD synthase [Thaumarchaeota archaeon]|nr:FAD synthase [Nitrososphaerota archaeon]